MSQAPQPQPVVFGLSALRLLLVFAAILLAFLVLVGVSFGAFGAVKILALGLLFVAVALVVP